MDAATSWPAASRQTGAVKRARYGISSRPAGRPIVVVVVAAAAHPAAAASSRVWGQVERARRALWFACESHQRLGRLGLRLSGTEEAGREGPASGVPFSSLNQGGGASSRGGTKTVAARQQDECRAVSRC
jgi:hypothetical protein